MSIPIQVSLTLRPSLSNAEKTHPEALYVREVGITFQNALKRFWNQWLYMYLYNIYIAEFVQIYKVKTQGKKKKQGGRGGRRKEKYPKTPPLSDLLEVCIDLSRVFKGHKLLYRSLVHWERLLMGSYPGEWNKNIRPRTQGGEGWWVYAVDLTRLLGPGTG